MSTAGTAHVPDPELDTLEARSQQLRSGLAETVGELKSRLSPETIKADVKEQVARTGQDMLAKLERSARENPLQTAAIGAGLAYPLIGILRSIPAPILLMGAGVALSGRGNLLSGLMSNDKLAGAVSSGAERASDAAGSARTTASGAAASVTSAVRSAADRTTSAAAAAANTVSETADAAVHSARANYHDGLHAAGEATDRAVALGRQGRNTLVDTVQRHPLMVGALTALAGAALAAMIPSSRTESRLFGSASSRVRDEASARAREGVSAVMDAGERVVGSTLQAARDEGLDAGAGREAIRDVADRAGAVVDAGINAVTPEKRSPDFATERPTHG
ncbi:hypothetical protein Sa4125_27440 [Aureimonas sp. SA4125]|uniref:DUF3618 domain-containing protein n=1 Tax=Aureimonas sp. SA4125 TaxID=2826993 RepID=UPI001CC5A404|nr:DUF3618 domain-containing protein [Aureimonas sp. SA4125]BDA85202.1 hypothetical protein Sa4125_27440 [Aureimonas sp. SA4125]